MEEIINFLIDWKRLMELEPIEKSPENEKLAKSINWITSNFDALFCDLPMDLHKDWIDSGKDDCVAMDVFIFAYLLRKQAKQYEKEISKLSKSGEFKGKEEQLHEIAMKKSEKVNFTEDEIAKGFHFWQIKLSFKALVDKGLMNIENINKIKLFSFDENESFKVKDL